MTKPKELTGWVMPFIEFEYDFSRCSIVDDINDFCEWRKFYSQPFTPEMLELFEESDEFSDIVDGEEIENNNVGCIGKPQTLNDFITLCNLAGVELNWKE